MKTPITYYGGKQQLAARIINMFPKHTTYVEPFCGGAAVFWRKQPSEVEIINDLNGELINFYRVLKSKYSALKKLVDETPFSRQCYKEASIVYNAPRLFDEVRRAWALWMLSVQGFAGQLDQSWGYDVSRAQVAKKVVNKKAQFTDELSHRLDHVQIECNNALRVIQTRDTVNTLHYVDPPYVGSDQGHYGGYNQEHFNALLDSLNKIEGRFILSSYPNDVLNEYIAKNGWKTRQFDMKLSAGNSRVTKSKKRKIEVLTMNFEPS